MLTRIFLIAIILLAPACTNRPGDNYEILVPDWRNNVVHRISVTGEYLGDLLDRGRFENGSIDAATWTRPRNIVALGDDASRFWLTTGDALSEWDGGGQFQRIVYSDTSALKDPAGVVVANGEVIVLAEDTRRMFVFGPNGDLLRDFINEELDKSTDMKIGPDGRIYVSGYKRNDATLGLVSVWNAALDESNARPWKYLIPPGDGDDDLASVQGFAFDTNGNVLVTEKKTSRVERWNVSTNERMEVLLDGNEEGLYKEIAVAPDGFTYLAGPKGVYRFDSRSSARKLSGLEPFFDAGKLNDLYDAPFSPTSITFVKLTTGTAGH